MIPAESRLPAPWLPNARCRNPDVNPAWWYPERGKAADRAKRICRSCPEIAACLNFALVHHEPFGIWGGVSARDRRKLARGDEASTVIELDNVEEPAAVELQAIEAELVNGNGNGHGAPVCSQCNQPAVPGRPTCGQPACVAGHRRESKRRRYSRTAPLAVAPRRRPSPAIPEEQAATQSAIAVVAALIPVAHQHPGVPLVARFDGVAIEVRSLS
jgi:WhiB family redox-sensing transcriptional regulator